MIDYKLGLIYRVSVLQGRNKTNNKITGKLIHQNTRHITLQNESGIKESFLKVDFKTGEYGITVI